MDYEIVFHGVSRLLHIDNPLELFLVIFAVDVLILWESLDRISLATFLYEMFSCVHYSDVEYDRKRALKRKIGSKRQINLCL